MNTIEQVQHSRGPQQERIRVQVTNNINCMKTYKMEYRWVMVTIWNNMFLLTVNLGRLYYAIESPISSN